MNWLQCNVAANTLGASALTELAHVPPKQQLLPIDLVAPGFRGLNLEQANAVLPPQWATEAQNTVLDINGRLAARLGFENQTTTPIAGNPNVESLFEQIDNAGVLTNILAWDGGISTSFVNPAGSDISGTVTDANGTWFFQNFNGRVLGFQAGVNFISRTTGNFAHIVESAGTSPRGGIALAAYGRVWGVDSDLQTIKYCSLLNELEWAGGTSGTIDMRNVWTNGTDQVTAIAAFNNFLIVFGRRHIVFWSDTTGNKLGIDPTNIRVVDVIPGTGTESQWSLQAVGETDLLFLSSVGVQSLKRLLVNRSSPIQNLTKYVRTDLLTHLANEMATGIRSTYNPVFGFYLLSFPLSGQVWVLDQRHRFQDDQGDEVCVITRWNQRLYSLMSSTAHATYTGRTGGRVAKYAGANDEGLAFRVIFQSPWLDLGQEVAQRLKILKRISAILFVRSTAQIIFKWATDFDDSTDQLVVDIDGDTQAEWGLGKWNESEWSGGLALRILAVPARATYQYIRVALEADVNSDFGAQQVGLMSKIGRLA